MTALKTFPSPKEIAALLAKSPSPSEPATDLATLESYFQSWPYPKSLDLWEGFVYADLCEQLGWALTAHEEYAEALQIWRLCPWARVVEGEKQTLAHLLQSAYEEKTLVLAPPVGDFLKYQRLALGTIIACLDDPLSTLSVGNSGQNYVLKALVVQPDGFYRLRVEFDATTIYFVSFLPNEVENKLQIARSNFHIGEYKEVAQWLLKAAYFSHQRGWSEEAFSFLEKGAQFDPEEKTVQKSLNNLRIKGIGPSLFSRVLVERALLQPEPVVRGEIRPEVLQEASGPWLEVDWPNTGLSLETVQERLALSPTLGLDQAQQLFQEVNRAEGPRAVLIPSSWSLPSSIDFELVEKRLSSARGHCLAELGLWKGDYRPALTEMLAEWPSPESKRPEPEVLDFALPREVRLLFCACRESWQMLNLLEMQLPELGGVEHLSAWLRRLYRRWKAIPFLMAQDVIWFQIAKLPEESQREMFLADLMSFSSDVAECFEPSMIKSLDLGGPFLFPVPLPLTYAANS